MKTDPLVIHSQYSQGVSFKLALGNRGLFEQSRINERFYIGDQWHGAKCGNERPLVRHNVIKRIGDYKMSQILNNPLKVEYSAEGVPCDIEKSREQLMADIGCNDNSAALSETEIGRMMTVFGEYYNATAQRINLTLLSERALKNAYISGTGILYTYWVANVPTGLFADSQKTVPIKGDIGCEVLNVEDVVFGDPFCESVQNQPYIIIASRKNTDEVLREARLYGADTATLRNISEEQSDGKLTVYTKLWKNHSASGKLTVLDLPQKVETSLIARFKVLSRMNIAEHRRTQDGTFTVKYNGVSYDFRINTLPVAGKEKMVIRILAPAASIKTEDKVIKLAGGTEEDLARINKMVAAPNGIILAVGPTGSGKTTTLYSILKSLNNEGVNITTLEDPVEIKIDGLNQSQINPKAGITFASCMKAILRQDPDIILIGEIRDFETLETAIAAALTGHLVLSTLHTNSAAATITRLIQMGAADYLISSTLTGIIAQRLVRRLCPKCKEAYHASIEEARLVCANPEEQKEFMKRTIYRTKGCFDCNNEGFKGRLGCYEVMLINKEIKKMIAHSAHDVELEEAAVGMGMKTLQASCLGHILRGETTIGEFVRVLGPVTE